MRGSKHMSMFILFRGRSFCGKSSVEAIAEEFQSHKQCGDGLSHAKQTKSIEVCVWQRSMVSYVERFKVLRHSTLIAL